MSTLTIEESIHVKFEKYNTLEINFLGEDIEKISLKGSPVQDDEVEPTPHSKE